MLNLYKLLKSEKLYRQLLLYILMEYWNIGVLE